jgi:hypothetical protein
VADINVKTRSTDFSASMMVVVVVSVAVVHVEAITPLDATGSTEALVAYLMTDAFCAGGNCQ